MNNTNNLAKILFDKYDTDKSGTISLEEFKSLAYNLGHYLTDGEAKFALYKIDTDGDGLVTFEEFSKWWRDLDRWKTIKYSQENLEVLSKLSEQFQTYDEDGNNCIDKKEFKELIKVIENKQWVYSIEEKELFDKLDKDKNGQISFNECKFLLFLEKIK
ncbi:hypothetical protein PIROE2DRAFT_62890 [Piromyces sp. E2]|nr:hypothetical protein PIROE2DRAFT_62890 [Piromyces sp. E2]|eukprot:OUM60859.1 hypothetical protein PIROE2DRAFT_62890 [Piromyces sp. E2]